MLLKWLSWKVKENIDVCFQSISLKDKVQFFIYFDSSKVKV